MRIIAISAFVILIFSNNSFACEPTASDFLVTDKNIKLEFRNVINVSGSIQNDSCLSGNIDFKLYLYDPEGSLISSEIISFDDFTISETKPFRSQFVINYEIVRNFSDNLETLSFEIEYIRGQRTHYNKPQGSKDKRRWIIIHLESPKDGLQGAKVGDSIIVEGTVDDVGITKAELLMNDESIPLKVNNGRFKKQIILPEASEARFSVVTAASTDVRMSHSARRIVTYDGAPIIILESPKDGLQGAKYNDPIWVEGIVDDNSISEAKLLLNGVPFPLKVINGRFKRKGIYLPDMSEFPKIRITTFQVMATGKNGLVGYSKLHKVFFGYDVDALHPSP